MGSQTYGYSLLYTDKMPVQHICIFYMCGLALWTFLELELIQIETQSAKTFQQTIMISLLIFFADEANWKWYPEFLLERSLVTLYK